MQYSALTLAALAGMAQAINVHVVNVGWNPVNNATGLRYWPDKMQAAAGDMVQFQFWAGAHTVTQSNFDNVCTPINEVNSSIAGVDSGAMPVAASADKREIPTYTVMINNTAPLWFYCKTGQHCKAGMAMVINENTSANSTRSLENYKSLAAGDAVNTNPGNGTGSGTGSGSGNGSGSGSGNGGSTGGNSGSAGGNTGSNGGSATVPAAGTPVGGDSSQATGQSSVPAGASSYGAPASTLLLVLGAAFMLL
ncbi:hypothetical protein NLU13_3371 [Sarocladium strictum]|uniref:Phytocyanin domain-containing protein n=1 Tax=Sarocladium strictum TaxID=5046 RepID=A0AA39GLV8_SARSR|nr:hypothetical protein NLU13_3371 [Sarocladium strictum]